MNKINSDDSIDYVDFIYLINLLDKDYFIDP